MDPAKRKPLQSDANSGDKSHVITSKNNEIKNDIGGRNLVHRAGEKALQAASPAKSEPKPPKKERVTVSSPKEEAPKNTPEPFAGAALIRLLSSELFFAAVFMAVYLQLSL